MIKAIILDFDGTITDSGWSSHMLVVCQK